MRGVLIDYENGLTGDTKKKRKEEIAYRGVICGRKKLTEFGLINK